MSEQLRRFSALFHFHPQLPDLLEQLSLLGLALLLLIRLALGEQLAGGVQKLPLLLAHLDRVDCVIGDKFLDRPSITNRLHGGPGHVFGTVRAAFAQFLRRRLRQFWEHLSAAATHIRG
jgi:hypothetical protein